MKNEQVTKYIHLLTESYFFNKRNYGWYKSSVQKEKKAFELSDQ